MTSSTRLVVVIQCANALHVGAPLLVATGAVVLAMAVNASEAEAVNVLLVTKDDLLPRHWLGSRFVDLGIRLWNRRVHPADDVVFRRPCRGAARSSGAGLRRVAYAARGLVAPLTMAGHALPVIGRFEPRLSHVFLIGRHLVTTLARGMDGALGCVMMAHSAALRHLGHLRMSLVVERDGQIEVLKFVQVDQVRTAIQRRASVDCRG